MFSLEWLGLGSYCGRMKLAPYTRSKFLLGFLLASFLFGSTAIAVNVNNTPEGGYLLCYNTTSKTVTFPGTLKCPKGTRPLELGTQGLPGQDGIDGLDGRTGAQGPAGPQGPKGDNANSSIWFYSISSRDIVGSQGATSFSALKKTIIASIGPENLKSGGTYVLTALLEGIWANQASGGDYINCYFQNASDYPNGSRAYGGASATYNSWTGIYLRVTGLPSDYGLGQSRLYLVCATNGVVQGLSGYLYATSAKDFQGMNLGSPPST